MDDDCICDFGDAGTAFDSSKLSMNDEDDAITDFGEDIGIEVPPVAFHPEGQLEGHASGFDNTDAYLAGSQEHWR